jgi:uridylate kinase
MKYQRVLLKLSGEALMGTGTDPFDALFVDYLAGEIAELHRRGVELGIVAGGGNIFRGLAGAARGVDRVSGDYMGMLATVINAVALASVLRQRDIPCSILSPFPMPQIVQVVSSGSARQELAAGRVVLFAGGTGNPFFTTDSAAVLRALEAGCQVVLKATKVDGVYDRDPLAHPDAVFLPRLTYAEAMDKRLAVMDQTAFSMCRENNLPIIVLNIYQPGNMLRALTGEPVGSLVDAGPQS